MSTNVQPANQHSSRSASDEKAPSFDEVSKLFFLPLSDAAETLGVCPSVLKKICYENGLVRWPHRKFLLGKSIEEIKEAAGERNAENEKLSNVADERNDALSSSGVSLSLGSQLQNKTSIYIQEMAKLRGMSQQQGNKSIQNGRSQNLPHSNLTKETPSSLDEFKYGFPSDGLATVTNRWWGSYSPGCDEDVIENGCEDITDKIQFKELADGGVNLAVDGENPVGGTHSGKTALRGAGLLSAVRKRSVEEGRKELKVNVYQSNGTRCV